MTSKKLYQSKDNCNGLRITPAQIEQVTRDVRQYINEEATKQAPGPLVLTFKYAEEISAVLAALDIIISEMDKAKESATKTPAASFWA